GCAWSVFYWITSTGDSTDIAHFVILAITITSLYAFGWPPEPTKESLHHAVSEQAIIFTLFLLSELAVALTARAHTIHRDFDQSMSTLKQMQIDKIVKSLEGSVNQLRV